jgi:hypothetical protein
MDRRQKQEALVKQIRDRAASFEVQSVLDLLTMLLEGAKNNLLTCNSNDFNRLQGEAQTYDKLMRLLTRPGINSSN